MSERSERGQADHRAVEIFERCVRVAAKHGRTPQQVERLLTDAVLADAARRFWERRGYTIPDTPNAEETHQ